MLIIILGILAFILMYILWAIAVHIMGQAEWNKLFENDIDKRDKI